VKKIASFCLPLELCPTTNATIGAHWSRVSKLRTQCYQAMLPQYARQFGRMPPAGITESPGHRVIICTRHSSSQPDRHANWSKIPIDALSRRTQERPHRLSLIWDDAEAFATVEEHWERAPMRGGFCTIEVFE
jgi:hypothetical protein